MRFRAPDAAMELVVSREVVDRLQRFRQIFRTDTEAGGLLLGRHLLDDRTRIVDAVTEPLPGDRRRRRSFFRGAAHQRAALRYWRLTRGTGAYLGSWHTHPEPDPHPSSVDRRDWAAAVARDSYAGASLCFVIVGSGVTRAWERSRPTSTDSARLRELERIDLDT